MLNKIVIQSILFHFSFHIFNWFLSYRNVVKHNCKESEGSMSGDYFSTMTPTNVAILMASLHICNSEVLSVQILNDLNNYVRISASPKSINLFCWKRLDPKLRLFFASSNFHLNIGTTEYKVSG